MDIVPPPTPEARPVRPIPDAAVHEAPCASQVIDVRPEALSVPPVVVSEPLGTSVSLPGSTGLR